MLKNLPIILLILVTTHLNGQNLENKWRLAGNLKTGNYNLSVYNFFTGFGVEGQVNTTGGRAEIRAGRFISPKLGINLEFISFWVNDKKNIYPQAENQLASAFITYSSLSVQRFFSSKKFRPFLKSEIALETTKRNGTRNINSVFPPFRKSQLTFNIGAGFSIFLKNYQVYDIGVQLNLLDWRDSKGLYRDGFPIAYFKTSILHDFKKKKNYTALNYPLIPKRQIEISAQAGSYFEFTGIYRQRLGKKMHFGAGISIINEEIGFLPYVPVWEDWKWLTEFEFNMFKSQPKSRKIKLPFPKLIYEGQYSIGAFDQFLFSGAFRNNFSVLLTHAKPYRPLRISYGLGLHTFSLKKRDKLETSSQSVFRTSVEYFISQNFSISFDGYYAFSSNLSESERHTVYLPKRETVVALNFYFQSPKDISPIN